VISVTQFDLYGMFRFCTFQDVDYEGDKSSWSWLPEAELCIPVHSRNVANHKKVCMDFINGQLSLSILFNPALFRFLLFPFRFFMRGWKTTINSFSATESELRRNDGPRPT